MTRMLSSIIDGWMDADTDDDLVVLRRPESVEWHVAPRDEAHTDGGGTTWLLEISAVEAIVGARLGTDREMTWQEWRRIDGALEAAWTAERLTVEDVISGWATGRSTDPVIVRDSDGWAITSRLSLDHDEPYLDPAGYEAWLGSNVGQWAEVGPDGRDDLVRMLAEDMGAASMAISE